ncbi:MAG: NADP-dependent oxidoreductase [Betaproteobacteria bacterium]|nr:NADP-dependent oxidoreductase [Betaproteobacteria bacterium]
MPTNQRIVLASRPKGLPTAQNFRLEEVSIPAAPEGGFVVRNHWLSLDPYMRGRMDAAKSYAKSVDIGAVMEGGTVGEVIASRHEKFNVGDFVTGRFGWQHYSASDGTSATKVDATAAPLSAYLGVLGMPGVTAWIGLLDIGQPKAGETVVVSAASGAVGGVVGQIAKIHGARTVGIAGGKEKCDYIVKELGFDACIDHKSDDLYEALEAACPKGIDVYFENVGGRIMDTVLALMNPFSRMPVCGLVSQYNAATSDDVYGLKNIRSVLTNRIKMQGFIVSDRMELWRPARADLTKWLADGKLRYRESVVAGLDAAPEALIGLLQGRNFGKQLVKLI